MTFNYNLPVNLIFGRGRSSGLGKYTSAYGKKALIVTGKGSTKRSGLLDRAVAWLNEAGVESVIFDKATPNPLTTTVMEGADLARSACCDVVVALGGGSVMDCAKGIAFMALNEGNVTDYISNQRTGSKALPFIAVPTTCGTGSEGNYYAVLSNPENGDKKSLVTPLIIPKASIIDSTLMETMPSNVLASVGFDALCHCMEAYVAAKATPVSDLMACEGMHLIAKNLVKVVNKGGTADEWDELTWASTLGGMAIHIGGCTLPHGLEHPASGLKNITHGVGLAALTPSIIKYSYAACPERYSDISKILGGNSAEDCADTVAGFIKALGLTANLSAAGINPEDVIWMVMNARRVSAATIANHPIQFSDEQLAAIYMEAL